MGRDVSLCYSRSSMTGCSFCQDYLWQGVTKEVLRGTAPALRGRDPGRSCVGEPFSSAAAGREEVHRGKTMSAIKNTIEQEPIGIVISRGSRAEAAPRFWAYVWGPAPETEQTEIKAA